MMRLSVQRHVNENEARFVIRCQAQSALARDARRQGLGTRVLRAARARAARPLRILNVDTRAEHIAAFLTAAGAVPLARQIEMVRARAK